ncbi:hypothetical protein GO988_13460 [Hymenobacter sp. HMF4947]|uniref:Uncharacterized protein n=1 Tax=Hymenobacter ginkgonis TaxID=2682976 RepID=A0A7K1TG13_9BACT|nr:hypothetical protein [Hymenobacter ginkgonis]MVN77337.1 hypothetical protein [Hymenobacter ginkgonis]
MRPSSASLVLLGLLGLLLWGQCAFHLNESGSKTPAAPNLHLKTTVRVVSVDSLSTHGPELVYLSIGLRNQARQPLQVVSLDGALFFDKQRLGFNRHPVGRGVVVPGGAERVFAVAMRPYQADDTHQGTNFVLLRAAWQQRKLARHHSQVTVFYAYQPYPGTPEQANWRRRTVPLVR